ncbi:MAG TPA: SDR family NAD(P)-dependent oxidoreductase [Microbacteriaceae bacterium]|nr:SDR family NAD(P)-dependent oxidoreductase [Microbacteriaceae bacterium]
MKVVAVTGGAGGIGRAIATAFADAGFSVAIGDLDEAAASNVAAEIASKKSGETSIIGMHLDVTKRGSYEQFFEKVESNLGKITHIVLSAGVMWVGPFDEESDQALEMQLGVNLVGVINGIKTGASRITAKGRIITIASAASFIAPPGEATYAATKHGVLGYLKAAREELRGKKGRSKIGITAIMPGVVDTKLAAGTASGAAKLLTPDEVAKVVLREATRKRPKFEVTIPGFIGPLNRFVSILPASIRDFMFRQMVPNQVKNKDSDARSAYESVFNSKGN